MDNYDVVRKIISYIRVEDKKILRLINKLWDQAVLDDFKTEKGLTYTEQGFGRIWFESGFGTTVRVDPKFSEDEKLDLFKKLTNTFPNLTTLTLGLSLGNYGMTLFIKTISEKLLQLKSLTLREKVSYDVCREIGIHLKSIEKLSIKIHDDREAKKSDLGVLYKCENLKDITFKGDYLSGKHFEHFRNLESISLEVGTMDLQNICERLVEGKVHLKLSSFSVRGNNSIHHIVDLNKPIKYLCEHFQNLRSLTIDCFSLTTGVSKHLHSLKNLEELEILGADVYDWDMVTVEVLSGLSKLKGIKLRFNIFHKNPPKSIEELCPNLEKIQITVKNNPVPKKALESISKLEKLKKFDVCGFHYKSFDVKETVKTFEPIFNPKTFKVQPNFARVTVVRK